MDRDVNSVMFGFRMWILIIAVSHLMLSYFNTLNSSDTREQESDVDSPSIHVIRS